MACLEHTHSTRQVQKAKVCLDVLCSLRLCFLFYTQHLVRACYRYEDEEAVDVCEAMERMAQLFLSDSGKVEDVTDEQTGSQASINDNGWHHC